MMARLTLAALLFYAWGGGGVAGTAAGGVVVFRLPRDKQIGRYAGAAAGRTLSGRDRGGDAGIPHGAKAGERYGPHRQRLLR